MIVGDPRVRATCDHQALGALTHIDPLYAYCKKCNQIIRIVYEAQLRFLDLVTLELPVSTRLHVPLEEHLTL